MSLSKALLLLALCCIARFARPQAPAAATPTYDAALAKRVGADARGMRPYVLVILKTGPTPMAKGKARDEMFEGHFANITRLAKAGKLALAGPFDDSPAWLARAVRVRGRHRGRSTRTDAERSRHPQRRNGRRVPPVVRLGSRDAAARTASTPGWRRLRRNEDGRGQPMRENDAMRIPLYQIDAFATRHFEGNPAAVMPVTEFPPDATMQALAAENNLSETAFLVRDGARLPHPLVDAARGGSVVRPRHTRQCGGGDGAAGAGATRGRVPFGEWTAARDAHGGWVFDGLSCTPRGANGGRHPRASPPLWVSRPWKCTRTPPTTWRCWNPPMWFARSRRTSLRSRASIDQG